jgi:hypothetical protein
MKFFANFTAKGIALSQMSNVKHFSQPANVSKADVRTVRV